MKIINKQTNNKYILKSKTICDGCNKKDILNEGKLAIEKYHSSLLRISNNLKIRPNLIKIGSLNRSYFKEEFVPNKFTSLKCGKFLFKVYIKSILSDGIRKNLQFNIYVNNELKNSTEYLIKEKIKNNIIFSTDLKVKKDDIVYFDYSIKEKRGNLTLSNINYEIKFSLENPLKKESKSLNATAEGDVYSSQIIDDNIPNSYESYRGINPWKTQIDKNTSDLTSIKNGLNDYPQLILNGTPITEWPSGGDIGSLRTSKFYDDSGKYPNEGINPYLIQIGTNTENIATKANQSDLDSINEIINQNNEDLTRIEQGTYDFPQLTLNGVPITEWPEFEGGISNSSELTDDSNTNPNLGINPKLLEIDKNTTDIAVIESGDYDYSKLTLNGQVITSWPSNEVESYSTSDIVAVNPTLEGGNNQQLINQSNKASFIKIENGLVDYPKLTLNGDEITEWPSGGGASVSSQVTNDSEVSPAGGINPLLNQIIANQNEILELKNQMEDLKLPIGSIIICKEQPSYGVWVILGALEEGQTIIGGNSSNGNIISHNHQWSAGITTFSAGLVVGIGNSINKFNTYDGTGNPKVMGNKVLIENNDTSQTGWTSLTGDENGKNKAYGLGLGTGLNVYRRAG